ncbi:putative SET domain-containing protein [Stachybotrys elegans]|uniref:SET domain-containing protein n=1 Tax=Stachybotrys elegans TaxID=80388 RepID=A0A8K0SFY2_9HYPO|nr:putative SET domain-containing protein [Stachybotrys elegans]
MDDLMLWAQNEGVELQGIRVTRIPGRGMGVVATRDIEEGTVVMTIPIHIIRSLHTLPQSISEMLPPDMSIQGLLAAQLALRDEGVNHLLGVMPDMEGMEEALPFMWPGELQDMLPSEAKTILAQKQTSFNSDWSMFHSSFPDTSQQQYRYAWFLVNSRTFYYETPETMLYPWHDRLALLPVADMFNHADVGCSVSYSTDGYNITADRAYSTGQELYTSYGKHSNDFLLAEYGFMTQDNRWDRICLEDYIVPRLSARQHALLEEQDRLTGFMLHKVQASNADLWFALRLLSSASLTTWKSFDSGEEDGEGTLEKARNLLKMLLMEYMDHIKHRKRDLQTIKVGTESQRQVLAQRWEQVEEMAKEALML